jgi:hypothetical protein
VEHRCQPENHRAVGQHESQAFVDASFLGLCELHSTAHDDSTIGLIRGLAETALAEYSLILGDPKAFAHKYPFPEISINPLVRPFHAPTDPPLRASPLYAFPVGYGLAPR